MDIIIGLKDLLQEKSIKDLKGKLLLQMFRLAESDYDRNSIYQLAISERFMEEARIIHCSMSLELLPKEWDLKGLPKLADQDKSKEHEFNLT